MAKLLQLRRGTTSQHSSFTGAVGEVTVDTDKDTLVVHDGSTAGGFLVASTASPTLTGTPTAPTATANTNTTQLATTAYVDQSAFAPLASPTLTGTPAAPTAAADTNTTQIATTAYVQTELGDYAPLASPTLTGTPTVPGYAPLAGADFTGGVTIKKGSTETIAEFVEDGAVKLYYDQGTYADAKFETTTDGVKVTGNLEVTDNIHLANLDEIKLGAGDGGDFSTPDHTIRDNNGELTIRSDADDIILEVDVGKSVVIQGGQLYGDDIAKFTDTGGCEFYYHDSKKFETTNIGITVTGSITTNSGGAEFNGDVRIANDDYFYLGAGYNCLMGRTTAGTPDYSEIQNRTEDFYIQAASGKTIAFTKWNNGTYAYGAEKLAEFIPDGAVNLYYDAVKKFETKADGVEVTGDLDVTTDVTVNSIANNAGGGATWALYNTGNADFTGNLTAVDLTLSGDLTVNGTTTTIDTTNLTVEDPLISLAKNNDSADTVDIGFYGLYDATGSQDVYTGLFRDANDSGKWKLFELNQTAPTTTVDVSGTGYAAATLVVGTLEDSKGDVRNIPASTNSTLVAADAGKHISITAGITINASTDFAIGDAVTIFNNQGDGNDETITATGITLYLASDATGSGNRTLAGRGVATILCVATDTYVITGAGLS